MKRELTCICCPLGCLLTVELDGSNILAISGYTCKRGKEYAETECTNPVRVVTSTVMNENGKPIPVKTDRAIAKEHIFDCMKILNGTVITKPVKIGDVVLSDVFGSNIIVTSEH